MKKEQLIKGCWYRGDGWREDSFAKLRKIDENFFYYSAKYMNGIYKPKMSSWSGREHYKFVSDEELKQFGITDLNDPINKSIVKINYFL